MSDQRQRCGEVHRQGLEVARVHADERRVRLERRIELALVMHLHQRVDPGASGLLDERAELVRPKRPHDEQHGVRAEPAGLPDAVAIDDEILAQHRQADARGGHEVVVAATEPRRLGEDRERRGAGRRISPGELHDRRRSTGHRELAA